MTILSPCTSPEVGRLLPDYIADSLTDSECESVERHLVDCRHCKGHYHTVMRVRRAAGLRRVKMMIASQNASPATLPAPAQAIVAEAASVQTAVAAFASSAPAVHGAKLASHRKRKA
jgi:hypothetical protein